jgi:hypothetical protein
LQNVSLAIPAELVGCVRNKAGRVFGVSCMLRHRDDALSVRPAAPHADFGVEGADVNLGNYILNYTDYATNTGRTA